ncbi:alcohol oxidase [Trametes meyenii]|nr:alcohol oxidase [Trametes meyenii]
MARSSLRAVVFLAACGAVRAGCADYPTTDGSKFVQTEFDYLVIGAGTAGTALSARLAEDGTSTVGLIEAGLLHLNDEIIDVPANSGVGNATYDWNFVSTPQEHANGRSLGLPRGKVVGGSSAINGMAWGRASAAEYDAWAEFAQDPSYGWAGFLPYLRKVENLNHTLSNPYPGISAEEAAHAAETEKRVCGFSGPITASYNAHYFDTVPTYVEALNNQGIPTNAEPLSGNATGVFNTLASLDRTAGVRSYGATAYYCANSDKPNFHLLVGAQATKVLFTNSSAGLVATGVEFASGGQRFVAKARKEVILSAGTVQTPQLLELSGIGNQTILSAHNITTLVDLPQVGENFQEHLYVLIQWQLKDGVETFDILRNNKTVAAEQAAQYAKNHTGLLADTNNAVAFIPVQSFVNDTRLQTLLDTFDADAAADGVSDFEKAQFKVQREWIADGNVAAVELIQWSKGLLNLENGASYVVVLGGILHPLSRGSSHISSSDPLAAPTIDPKFLSRDFDTQVLLDVLKFLQKIGKTAPFSDLVAAQTNPDPNAQSDEELLAYVRAGAAGGDHLIGTAAQAPREQGGVVDAELKVYGTTNLRVADASILPIQLAAHTQATIYALGEKAADLIKGVKAASRGHH